ncbi:zeta toxin family protein [Pseudomonas sp. 6D_7.1_Bac1]|uniref:zeta toxin family protein n=1 Tax=Pseudomonas sp. 6D_7.1_Bac1 TaxID=2971615 RepID=UPI0021C65B10|nr:zeta toxin family protein [Pseudomonas sp. 6D_7.1_Bac1]MCU1752139.1 zeta toxin family protein [Pseudomonas sp. 6D_7.1_Bac1]
MTQEEQEISDRALEFAKENRTRVTRELTCLNTYPGDEYPVSVFMAGSPGAGKTEVSKAFIEVMQARGSRALRIDPDDFRDYFPEYTGRNSSLFQRGVTKFVERTIDLVYNQRQSFLLDGTLANLEVARRNIARALDKVNRSAQIIYVYQRPELAWEFVLAREKKDGRNIPCPEFVRQFYAAKVSVCALKRQFEGSLQVDVIIKDNDGENADIGIDLSADEIDGFVNQPYAHEELENILNGVTQ